MFKVTFAVEYAKISSYFVKRIDTCDLGLFCLWQFFYKVLTEDQDKGKMDEVKVEKSRDVGIIIDKRRCHCPAGFWKRGLEITGLSFVTLLYRVS